MTGAGLADDPVAITSTTPPPEPRRFGIEEEFCVLSRDLGAPVSVGSTLLQAHDALQPRVSQEFLASQVETSTLPCVSAAEAEDSLRTFRRTAAEILAPHGLILASTGTPLVVSAADQWVSSNARYLTLEQRMQKVAQGHFVNGLHVHVSIKNRDEGVRAIAGLGKWAPLLVAMTANAPIWEGTPTGFASWRHILMKLWPISNYPPPFESGAGYDSAVKNLLDSGLILDLGMICWVVRLSANYPTLEVRIADAQLSPTSSVGFAVTLRALIDTILLEPAAPLSTLAPSIGLAQAKYLPGNRTAEPPLAHAEQLTELINASMWSAARDGLEHELVDPHAGERLSTGLYLDRLLTYITPSLKRHDDFELVGRYFSYLKMAGSPANLQLEQLHESGIGGVLELFETSHETRPF